VATEVADTRGWTTLPDTIQIFRVPVAANKNVTITVKPEYEEPKVINVTLAPGEKKLYRFRTSD